jgi:hypothetical protein
MGKKKIIFVVMLLALTFIANTAFAETTSTWSPSYSGVYYQYVNQFGGIDYDGLRWYKATALRWGDLQNKLSNGSIVKGKYLSGGERACGRPSSGERALPSRLNNCSSFCGRKAESP